MQNNIRQAREDLGWSRAQLAEKMGVDVSTVGNWETGSRQIPLDKLLSLSKITGFTVHYLLGIGDPGVDMARPLPKEVLAIMHRKPVWTATYGWGLVNNATHCFVFADGATMDMEVLQEPVYAFPPALSYSLFGAGEPLARTQVEERERVWVEPITTDNQLSDELRGWYCIYKERLVENEFGHRFYLDAYGVKWLAFEDCFEHDRPVEPIE